jgi:CRISPR-associated protein Csx3
MALHKLHNSPPLAIAFYDLRLGAVVVASHNPSFTLGQVIDVTIPKEK